MGRETERRKEVSDYTRSDVIQQRNEAMDKAIDSLSRYKFFMFGYWAALWVTLNRLSGENTPNPFRSLVNEARRIKRGSE